MMNKLKSITSPQLAFNKGNFCVKTTEKNRENNTIYYGHFVV